MNQLVVISMTETSSVVKNNNHKNKNLPPNNFCPNLTSSRVALQTASV
jgi:hypothetical protein